MMHVAPTDRTLPTRELLADDRFDVLAAIAACRLGACVDPGRLQATCKRRGNSRLGTPEWSDATYLHWLLNRAVDSGLEWDRCPPLSGEEIVTAILHTGFIMLIETAEHIARLRNENVQTESKAARSKISKTQQRIEPIDRVAARVASEAT